VFEGLHRVFYYRYPKNQLFFILRMIAGYFVMISSKNDSGDFVVCSKNDSVVFCYD
jgi:hypothetical protein